MLGLSMVRVLAAALIAATVGGWALGHALAHPRRSAVRVVARREPGRWTEAIWIGGALAIVFWQLGVLLVPDYAYDWPVTPDFPFSSVLQVVGFSVALAGGLLFFSAARTLGRHMTPAIQVQEGHRLVQEGPYRYVRHPVYTAILTASVGLSVLYLSPVLAVLWVLLVAIASYRAHLEEDLLSSPEGFGPMYREYAARTGRFLPRLAPRRFDRTNRR